MEIITSARKSAQYCFKRDYFEQKAWLEEKIIIGVDEVGRGCLLGPVVTAAVAIINKKSSNLIKDSKELTAPEREKAYNWIVKNCLLSIGISHHRIIDAINIRQATLKAMRKAIIHLSYKLRETPQAILIDAMPLDLSNTRFFTIPQFHFFKGEKHSSSIAAASIVAKVTRDRLMHQINGSFPCYKLTEHKGYGTKKHILAIKQYGNSVIHRTTFVIHPQQPFSNTENTHESQQTLW